MESKQDDTFKFLKHRLWAKSNDFSSKRPVTKIEDRSAELNFTAFLNSPKTKVLTSRNASLVNSARDASLVNLNKTSFCKGSQT
jgi:hypothetical protein